MRSSRLLSLVRWLVIQAKRLPTTLRERQVPCLLSPTSTRRVAYNSTRCPWVPLLRRRNSRLPLKYSAVFVIEVSVVEERRRDELCRTGHAPTTTNPGRSEPARHSSAVGIGGPMPRAALGRLKQ